MARKANKRSHADDIAKGLGSIKTSGSGTDANLLTPTKEKFITTRFPDRSLTKGTRHSVKNERSKMPTMESLTTVPKTPDAPMPRGYRGGERDPLYIRDMSTYRDQLAEIQAIENDNARKTSRYNLAKSNWITSSRKSKSRSSHSFPKGTRG